MVLWPLPQPSSCVVLLSIQTLFAYRKKALCSIPGGSPMMFGREFADGVITAKHPLCECHDDVLCIV